jgi:hypothetical protein
MIGFYERLLDPDFLLVEGNKRVHLCYEESR